MDIGNSMSNCLVSTDRRIVDCGTKESERNKAFFTIKNHLILYIAAFSTESHGKFVHYSAEKAYLPFQFLFAAFMLNYLL